MVASNRGRGLRRCILFAILLSSTPAGAQGAVDNIAAAEAFFQEAVQLSEAGRTVEACPKFAESHRLDPQGGVAFELASCYEKLGKMASAWGAFNEASARRRLRNDKRADNAQSRALALEPQLAKLAIVVPEGSRVPGLSVKRDGVEVGRAQWDSAVPVDRGEVMIEASAPGKELWRRLLRIERAGVLNLEIPVLADAKVAPADPSGPAEVSVPFWSAQRIAAVNAVGLGVVGLALGLGLGVDASQKLGASEPYCQPGTGAAPDVCTPEARPLRDGARAAGTGSTVAFIAGGALIAGAAVLWFTASRASERSKSKAAVWISPSIGGAMVGGQF